MVDFVDIDCGFVLINKESDEEESESMVFRTIHAGLCSSAAGPESESDNGGNGEELN